jgi:ATP-dependent RNA helicase HelY
MSEPASDMAGSATPGAVPAADAVHAEAFAATYGFALDQFQLDGMRALAQGRSVLVAAPTGAGKTVVGEYAVWQALATGGKCFYTTPIKALSNQKLADLRARHGDHAVGLLTGDHSINGEAPIVVMTTEVLRNMLYEQSPTLAGLQAVVLDEVHYLADRARGAVWEEVIIQLPLEVQLACLSATVSNAEEFGAWLRHVRPSPAAGEARRADDSCDVVISEHRPVPLEHHYAVGQRVYDLFRAGKSGGAKPNEHQVRAAKRAQGGVPNPEVLMLERGGQGKRVNRRGRHVPAGPKLRPPRRSEMVELLAHREWLPAIVFVFSRGGCDQAVQQLVGDGVSLTTRAEREQIRAELDRLAGELPGEDLDVLGFAAFSDGLVHGVGAHHAGLVPAFKEVVERLFVRGLVKVCFATETLALGINMPARTVVIERLEKWTGQSHELLTPGQLTQLTGRAGRRGLDEVGHAVIAYQRDVDFKTVASLVGRRTQPLTSSFAPSYNMAVNLLRRVDRPRAEGLLGKSFGQYQANQRVSVDTERIERNRQALAGYAANLTSTRGDFTEYWALRRELDQLEDASRSDRRRRQQEAVAQRLAQLAEGDVVALPASEGPAEMAAITGRSTSKSGNPLARAVTADARSIKIGPRELEHPPVRVGSVGLPDKGGPRQAAWRKRVASSLHELDVDVNAVPAEPIRADPQTAARMGELRQQVAAHPVHDDPQREDLEVWAQRYDDLEAETLRLERHVEHRAGSLVRDFQRIVGVLAELGYVAGGDDDPTPTALGLRLAGLYADTDLVLAESVRAGVLDDLHGPELAAVASAFTYETRLKDPPPVTPPTAAVAERLEAVDAVWQRLAAREDAAGLERSPRPDPGFSDVVHRWAAGEALDDALGGVEMTAGDFVRNVKQVDDLLRQIRDAESGSPLGDAARRAAQQLVRGVVATAGM